MSSPNIPEVPVIQVLDWYRGKLADATERIAVLEIALENSRRENEELRNARG